MRSFTRSNLVRLLGGAAAAPPPGMDFAERMSLWLDAFAAVRLQGAMQSVRAVQGAVVRDATTPAKLAADVARVRSALAKAIAREVTHEEEPRFAAYRQRHLDLQHQMELAINPLRDHVRQVLAQGSVRLRQLAALDAALDEVLAGREQVLLPAAAALTEPRFDADGLEAFEQHWREVLLAEVDHRLERITGLVEAHAHGSPSPP